MGRRAPQFRVDTGLALGAAQRVIDEAFPHRWWHRVPGEASMGFRSRFLRGSPVVSLSLEPGSDGVVVSAWSSAARTFGSARVLNWGAGLPASRAMRRLARAFDASG